jgi:4-hydroxy-tetrahydrodipicolinate synthase
MFTGTYTALVTPFTDNNQIDYPALAVLIERQIAAGITGIVFLGTTGESPTISRTERSELIRFGIQTIAGRCQILVGTGSNNTAEAIELSLEAQNLGADGLLIACPSYNKPTQTGLIAHFSVIADAVNIPIMLYNVPGRSGVNMLPNTTLQLATHKNIVSLKEASGDLAQMMEIMQQAPAGFTVLSGDDALALPLIAVGGHGVVSVVSNIYPREIFACTNAALSGDFATAREQHLSLLPRMNACFIQTNPLPVKTILADQGFIQENFRLPLCPMDASPRKTLLKTFHFEE